MKNLTAKKIQICLKNGYTPEEMMEKYECSLEELEAEISRIYHEGNGTKAKAIFAEFEANRKKANRRKKPVETVVEEPTTEEPAPTEPTPAPRTLADLQSEENTLSHEVMALEAQYEALLGNHRVDYAKLRAVQERLEKLKAELIKCKNDYEQVAANIDRISKELNEVSKNRRDKLVALDQVRQEIDEMLAVVLYVYEDGQIEAPEHPEFILDDTGHEALAIQLFTEKSDCLAQLLVPDVVTLARLLKISEKAERFNLICDNADLERAFWAIREKA